MQGSWQSTSLEKKRYIPNKFNVKQVPSNTSIQKSKGIFFNLGLVKNREFGEKYNWNVRNGMACLLIPTLKSLKSQASRV